MKLATLFFALITTVASVASVKYSCYVRTYFAKLCYQFDFEGDCQPWHLEKCKPIRVTTMDYHCPRYFCDPIEEESWPAEIPSSPTTPGTLSTAPSTAGSASTTTTPATGATPSRDTSVTARRSTELATPVLEKRVDRALEQKPLKVDDAFQPAQPSVKMILSHTKDASEEFWSKEAASSKSSTSLTTSKETSLKASKLLKKTIPSMKSDLRSPVMTKDSLKMKTQSQLSAKESEAPGFESSSHQQDSAELSGGSPPDLASFRIPIAPSEEASLPFLPPSSETKPTEVVLPLMTNQDDVHQVKALPEPSLFSNPESTVVKESTSTELTDGLMATSEMKKNLTVLMPISTEKNATLTKMILTEVVNRSTDVIATSMVTSAEVISTSIDVMEATTKPSSEMIAKLPNSTPMVTSDSTEQSFLMANETEMSQLVQEVSRQKTFEEHLEEFLRMPRIRSATSAEKDCGSKVCIEELHFEAVCVLYVDESDEATCDFPCSKANCTEEIHYSTDCPTWLCFDKTTTTPAPTTSSPSTPPSPSPSHGSSCFKDSVCITSVTVNGLIFLVFGIVVSVFLKKRYFPTPSSSNTGMENPLFDDFVNYNPIIRTPIIRASSERLPLLPLRSTESQSAMPFLNQGLSQTSRLSTTSASSVALNPSAPDLPYVEANF